MNRMTGAIVFFVTCGSRKGGRQKMITMAKHNRMTVDTSVSLFLIFEFLLSDDKTPEATKRLPSF